MGGRGMGPDRYRCCYFDTKHHEMGVGVGQDGSSKMGGPVSGQMGVGTRWGQGTPSPTWYSIPYLVPHPLSGTPCPSWCPIPLSGTIPDNGDPQAGLGGMIQY